MKTKYPKAYLWLKRIFCLAFVCALALPLLTLANPSGQQNLQAGTTAVTEEELITKVNPILKSYQVFDTEGLWRVLPETRFLVAAEENLKENQRLAEVVKLVNAEFTEKKIASSVPHAMLYASEVQRTPQDIFIRLAEVEDLTSETESEETYQITIDDTGVVIEAASENAVLYALRTIEALMTTNRGLVYGRITDYPDVAERRLHVDCGRKYISKDWFIREIREMSYLKMNALQIHFSENFGFRIECETDPAIMSEEYLTKAEVREILAEAEKYGVKVIPSFDSPGHVDQILKAHPEYGQISTDGTHYASGLDVTNPEAVAYIYSLYDEYMELFEGCTDFHIGGDEYMEFDRAPFTTKYQSILNDYAVKTFGPGYTWKDTLADYINNLAEYVFDHGFKPRVWNDGLYYGENSSTPQKIKMHSYIGVDFWSQMSWNRSISTLQQIIDRGHKDVYNVNASYFYYVLRPSAPTDGREQHSFDVLNQEKNIYETWMPGKFQENTINDDHEAIRGASVAVWCDQADVCTEDVIASDIGPALRSLASKSWNTESSSRLDYTGFQALTETLGYPAGYEKGSVLPEVGEFTEAEAVARVWLRCVDEAGHMIREDQISYGEKGSSYEITAPEVPSMCAVTGVQSGIYTEEEVTLTFVYEPDPDAEMRDSGDLTYPSVQEYVTGGGEFVLSENPRFIIEGAEGREAERLIQDLQLLSSEFAAKGLVEQRMEILQGADVKALPGDILIRLEEEEDADPEAYEIQILGYARVSASHERGIFYGIRTIEKGLLLNDKTMEWGRIQDAPAVSLRAFHLDNARKFFTKDWILALIRDLSWQNFNSLQFHFSENEGFRLESSTLEAIEGFHYPTNGYLTKADMLEIIAECKKYHIELVPSLDSPGHMKYVLDFLPDAYDSTALFAGDFRAEQTFNIFQVPEAKEFLVSLFTEYAEFFSEAGCTHMNIGGDEFLNNFGSMSNDQHRIVMDYFNEIAALVKSYGLTPRAWNDGLRYQGFEDYTLDPDIEICYWSGPASTATIQDFVENGHKVINYSDVYMYFALAQWWMQNANASGEKIFKEWTPGKLAGSSTAGDQSVDYPYPDYLLGASYALWCDDPNYMTQEAVASNLFLRTRAMAEKSWNPNTSLSFEQFQTLANDLGRVPGYDSRLPVYGDME